MESFFALLQRSVLDRRRWTTREELRIAIVTWIERTFNWSSQHFLIRVVRDDVKASAHAGWWPPSGGFRHSGQYGGESLCHIRPTSRGTQPEASHHEAASKGTLTWTNGRAELVNASPEIE